MAGKLPDISADEFIEMQKEETENGSDIPVQGDDMQDDSIEEEKNDDD